MAEGGGDFGILYFQREVVSPLCFTIVLVTVAARAFLSERHERVKRVCGWIAGTSFALFVLVYGLDGMIGSM